MNPLLRATLVLLLGIVAWPLAANAQHETATTVAHAAVNKPVSAPIDAAVNPGTPWPATDALNRTLPTPDIAGPPKPGRFVGIFYFLTHEEGPRGGQKTPYDVARILAADPDARKKPQSPLWGPFNAPHYWGEPLYGYYRSDDPWVIRRHAQLLADAGVDTLIFDTTNAVTYPKIYRKICEVFTQVRRDGGRTPQIAFMVNTQAGKTAQHLYDDLYQPGLFRDLWFNWRGKPLLICDPQDAPPEIKAFFTLRRAHWPFQMINTPYAWHWEAAYPQPYGYTDDPQQPEQVNVAVAQNLRASDGKVTNMSEGNARGRSFHNGAMDLTPGAINHGFNFQEQWARALQLAPPFVMVTGWNEWTAGRRVERAEKVTFVDQYNEEFSRDIEPMKGGHGDNYYYQLVANVRKFKGMPPLPTASPPRKIDIDGAFDQWREVLPDFAGCVGNTAGRDFAGCFGTHYVNTTGRNNFVSMKVARDAQNIYFYARTQAPISPHTDPQWMTLLIDADQNSTTGWEGYDYAINRVAPSEHTAVLEKCLGGWRWEKVADVAYRVAGNDLQLAIPRAALGLSTKSALDFKWTDNMQSPGDIMDFYSSGDVAPLGRFKFRYVTNNGGPEQAPGAKISTKEIK